MATLNKDRLGICSWSTHPKNASDLADRLDDVGLKKVQLALNPLRSDDTNWGDAQKVLADRGITIASGMFGTVGEDYSSIEAIRRTGGVVPDEHWQENWQVVQDVSVIAEKLGLSLVSTHAGFLPHDPSDPDFAKLVDRIAMIAKNFESHGLTLLFETGQENADTLQLFLNALDETGATNTAINFDPANMILYDMGDPIDSLRKLLPRVKQVHIKDGIRTKTPGEWGAEVAIGQGEVDWPAFMQTLSSGNYEGDLIIEREAGEDRVGDIRIAIDHLEKTMQAAG